MSLQSHDLAAALRVLHDGEVDTRTMTLPGFECELVYVPTGMRFEHSAPVSSTLLVLSGTATIALDDWRATLSGGHLLGVPGQARLLVVADGGTALELLLTRAPQPPAPTT